MKFLNGKFLKMLLGISQMKLDTSFISSLGLIPGVLLPQAFKKLKRISGLSLGIPYVYVIWWHEMGIFISILPLPLQLSQSWFKTPRLRSSPRPRLASDRLHVCQTPSWHETLHIFYICLGFITVWNSVYFIIFYETNIFQTKNLSSKCSSSNTLDHGLIRDFIFLTLTNW